MSDTTCACGDEWPDSSMGCGHTPWRCESFEGAGLFDPDAITAPGPDAMTTHFAPSEGPLA